MWTAHQSNRKLVWFFSNQLLKNKVVFKENLSHSNMQDELEIGSDKGKENK
jgi:hypothetical protein